MCEAWRGEREGRGRGSLPRRSHAGEAEPRRSGRGSRRPPCVPRAHAWTERAGLQGTYGTWGT